MRSPTPHRKLPAWAVAVGVASALTLAACGASGDVDAAADLRTANSQLNVGATETTLASTIPAVPAIDNGDQATTDDGAPQAPGLPVASDQVEATPIAQPADRADDGADDDGAAVSTATTQGSVTTMTSPASETTTTPATQPPSTVQAPTTSQPVAANLPNLAVLDLASGSSVGFPQAARANGGLILLWFWSPT